MSFIRFHLIKLAYDAGEALDSNVRIHIERIVSGDQFIASDDKKNICAIIRGLLYGDGRGSYRPRM